MSGASRPCAALSFPASEACVAAAATASSAPPPPPTLTLPPLSLPSTGRPLEGSTTQGIIIPDPLWDVPEIQAAAGAGAAGASYRGGRGRGRGRRRRSGPPDLPSLLMDSRIVYLGMPVS